MTRASFKQKLEIIIDYLCSKMRLPAIVGERASRYFYNLPLGRKPDMPFPVMVYFVLKCIHLAESAHKWSTNREIDLDKEVVELASVLAERIHAYETPRQ